jgi:histone H3/H4
MKRGVFSLFDMDDYLRQAGAQRVSECASLKLCEILEDSGKQLLFEARIIARHSGRKDINANDVRLAASFMKN